MDPHYVFLLQFSACRRYNNSDGISPAEGGDPAMDHVDRYREIIRRVLTELANYDHSQQGLQSRTVFDAENDSYLVVTTGWEGLRRVDQIVAHFDIIDGKIWAQADNTNLGLVRELEAAGVPKHDIVLGFRHLDVRPLTEYAVA
jgi:hypothetical protein